MSTAATPAATPPATSAPEPAHIPPFPAANELQVARYTTLASMPSEADAAPLAVVAKVHFPRPTVNTVGDAVRHLLLRTGYQLVAEDSLDGRVRAVLALRLPDNQRVLGPYRVDAMLGVLLGRPFRLAADPASRTVTYVAVAPEGNPASARGSPVVQPAGTQRDVKAALESASASFEQRGSR